MKTKKSILQWLKWNENKIILFNDLNFLKDQNENILQE